MRQKIKTVSDNKHIFYLKKKKTVSVPFFLFLFCVNCMDD